LSTFFANTNSDEERAGEGRDENRPISIPLYVAAGAVQISALVAVAYQVAEPAFAYFTIILTILGLIVSYNLRRIGTSPRLIFMGTLVLGLVFLYALRGAGVFGAIIPLEVQGSQEILLITALAFTATFASFLLLTDEAAVFTCVWAIAIIGLTGTVNINRELIVCFVAFLASAAFLLIHQNALAQSAANQPRWPQRFRRWRDLSSEGGDTRRAGQRLLKTQLLTALMAWFIAIVLGFIVAIPVQMIGRNLSLASIIQRLKVPPSAVSRAGVLPRLVFDDVSEFNVGLGPIDDDTTEKMNVLSQEPHYWRGRTFDLYTGKGWRNTIADLAEEVIPTPQGDTPEGFATFEVKPSMEPSVQTEEQTHRFSIRGGAVGPLYHAAEPQVVRAPIGRIMKRPDNTVGVGRGGSGDYEVVSAIVQFTANQLRATPTDYPDEIRRRYLSQGQTNDALRSLAQEAIIGATNNPFDKVQAIRQFISNRCIYTRDARAVPRDRDAVEFFLNESKEGYCDLYATSMTMLCRYAGIPARVATGFAPGISDENYTPPTGEKRQRYILRGSDQHAWTEVYFVGIGWIHFDATQDTLALTAPAQTPVPEREETGFQKWLRTGKYAIVLIGVGLLGVLFVLYNEFFRRGSTVRVATSAQRPFATQVTQIYIRSLRQVERSAFPRSLSETPKEFAKRLSRDFDPVTGDGMVRLTEIANKAFYGPQDVTAADVQMAKEIVKEIQEALKTRKERGKPLPTGGSHANPT